MCRFLNFNEMQSDNGTGNSVTMLYIHKDYRVYSVSVENLLNAALFVCLYIRQSINWLFGGLPRFKQGFQE